MKPLAPSTELDRARFPFAAVAGQQRYKLALMLAAVNPAVGGVLVSGPRGCAKSTLARALVDILPRANNAQPFVTLPLGATEEMLLGSLDLQQVLSDKTLAFKPGLLAHAHGGVLYVDEVNLLPDHLVDLLLDVAASGVNTVERDGISHSHLAEFILLGTMNPDEGELRPQLLDRFGLSVELGNQFSLEQRVAIVRLREAFEKNSAAFVSQYHQQQQALREQIQQARQQLGDVTIADDLRLTIASRCQQAEVDGLRADIVWAQAAIAHAAIAGRNAVTADDINAVEALVLAHRRQASPPSKPPPPSSPPSGQSPQHGDNAGQQHSAGNQGSGDWGAMPPEQQATANEAITLAQPVVQPPQRAKPLSPLAASRSRQNGSGMGGQPRQSSSAQVNWFRSLANAAGRWPLPELCYKRQRQAPLCLHIVMLDTSASVLSGQGFAKAKAWLLALAEQAYQRREQLAVIGFGKQQVELLMSRRRAPKAIRQWLDQLSAGGGTPLADALQYAAQLQQQVSRKTPGVELHSYLLSDGRISDLGQLPLLAGSVTVVDVEQAAVPRGIGRRIADALGAQYVGLSSPALYRPVC